MTAERRGREEKVGWLRKEATPHLWLRELCGKTTGSFLSQLPQPRAKIAGPGVDKRVEEPPQGERWERGGNIGARIIMDNKGKANLDWARSARSLLPTGQIYQLPRTP